MIRPHREQIAEARKALQPTLEVDAFGLWNRCEIDRHGDTGAFREHGRSADEAALTDVLRGFRQTKLGKLGKNVEVAAQPFWRSICRRLPVRERLAVTATQIDRCDETIAW